MRPAASPRACRASLRGALLACAGAFVAVACSTATPSASERARDSASVRPVWTAPPAGAATPSALPTPSPSPSPLDDAARGVRLTGTYRLVDRPNDTSLSDAFSATLPTSALKSRAASREVWNDTGQVGGMVVIDLIGMDLPDDALRTFATAFAGRSSADLTWATIGGRQVALISQGAQRLELFLLSGDLVIVAGIQPALADDITRSLIEQNA